MITYKDRKGGSETIDMRRSTAMANHAFRDLEDVEETDAQAQIVDYLLVHFSPQPFFPLRTSEST